MSLPDVTEQPHFEKISFRIKGKIFLTLDLSTNRGCVKLTEKDQDLFSVFDKTIVYPVPNKWGQKGYTFVDLGRIPPETMVDLIRTSYSLVAPKKLDRKK